MSENDRRDDLLIALALTEFSVHYETADPELANRAWQLGADRLLDYELDVPCLADELEVGNERPR